MGFFQGPPNLALRAYDRVANHIQSLGNEQGLGNPIPGEDKDLRRYSIPVFSEPISTLPAMVRMLGPYKLAVVDGVTSLVTEIRNMQPLYKAPSSVDFNINGIPFRSTAEYISSIQTRSGAVIMDNIVPIAGMTFIGATTKEAFFYSPATRMYYSFSSNRDLTKRDVFNRFHDIIDGRWDFVNQEVIFKCLLGKEVLVCRLDGNVLGEVYPPNETIFNKRSGFKVLSMAGGLTYQGPKRFAVNRFITNEHMYYSIRFNKDDNKWTHKLSREEFWAERDYGWHYEDWYTVTDQYAAMGWTHNPFKLATAMLGIDEKTDAKFEWELTFAWTDQMEALYRPDEYVTVNIQAETITQGGVVLSPVTRIYLFKECFTRSGNFGYYTFQFQSNNGIGNRERLYVWSDGIIALEDLQVSTKQMTTHRMNPAFTQLDIKDLKEF
jgi:hypothetical protein